MGRVAAWHEKKDWAREKGHPDGQGNLRKNGSEKGPEEISELQEEQKRSWKPTHSLLERSIPSMTICKLFIFHFHIDKLSFSTILLSIWFVG